MGSPADVGVLLFPRWLLVLIASGIPLAVGVVLTVLPRLITVVLVVASAFFIGGMAIGPTVTLCVLKASLPGLALAVPAGVTSWWRLLPKSRAQGTYEPESWEMQQFGSKKVPPQESLIINMKPSTAQTGVPAASSQSRAETE